MSKCSAAPMRFGRSEDLGFAVWRSESRPNKKRGPGVWEGFCVPPKGPRCWKKGSPGAFIESLDAAFGELLEPKLSGRDGLGFRV